MNQLDHFVDVIHGNATPLITARDGTSTLAVTLAEMLNAVGVAVAKAGYDYLGFRLLPLSPVVRLISLMDAPAPVKSLLSLSRRDYWIVVTLNGHARRSITLSG